MTGLTVRDCCLNATLFGELQVTDGSGKALVIAVGAASEWGTIMEHVTASEADETPLQQKLGAVSANIDNHYSVSVRELRLRLVR